MPSQTKSLYGKMFEIKETAQGVLEAEVTQDPSAAVPIVSVKEHRRCPHCSSDKCFEDMVDETWVQAETFVEEEKLSGLKLQEILSLPESSVSYLLIARCRKTSRHFLVPMPKLRAFGAEAFIENNRCHWCASDRLEKIPDVDALRSSYFKPEKLSRYKEGASYSGLKGMPVNDVLIFALKDPHRCKQCKRISGYGSDKEGWQLFRKLCDEVQKTQLERYLDKRYVGSIRDKLCHDMTEGCPLCHREIDFWKLQSMGKLATTATKPKWDLSVVKCPECKKEFISVEKSTEEY